MIFVQSAAAKTVEDIIADENGHVFVDSLPLAERGPLIGEIAEQINVKPLEVARLLCIVRSWTTGSPTADGTLREMLWNRMADENDAESEIFRWLDCAAANGVGGYRDKVLDPMENLRIWMCTSSRSPTDRISVLSETIAGIEAFNTITLTGVATAEGAVLRSFYPARNALRLATLRAGVAVAAADQGNLGTAREWLEQAVAGLEQSLAELNSSQQIAHQRNGWRLWGDLTFFRDAYSQLAASLGDGPVGSFEARDVAYTRPARENALFADAISADLAERMGPDHVDFIYVDRLLPGASYDQIAEPGTIPEAECTQWRRRSYDPVALVEAWDTCGDNIGLAAFDRCMLGFEAQDWTLTFTTVPGPAGSENVRLAERYVRDYVAAIGEQLTLSEATDLLDRLQTLSIEEVGRRQIAISSANTFSTSERKRLTEIIDRIDPANNNQILPLFRRPPQY